MNKCIAIPLLLLAAVAVLASDKSARPVLTCKVPAEKSFSNLKRIPLEVHLKSLDIDVDRALVNPEHLPVPGTPYLEIFAEEVSEKGRVRVPLKLSRTGEGRELSDSYVNFDMEIPIEESERRQKISKHLDDILREGKAKNADPKLLKLYEDKGSREGLINTFERIYVQSRVGTFDIGCQYFPNPANYTATAFQSPRVRVNVENKGDFLDQPTFH